MSRIDLNVVATGNFGQLESQLARLKAQISGINASMSSAMMMNPAAVTSMQNYANLMADNLRSTGMFQTKMVSLTSETERFGQSLQRGNIRLGDYFRTATGHIRNQQTEIQRLAREQVRLMNSTSIAMGDGRAMVITPTGIDEAIHKQQILNQEYRIFRQVVQGGSTQLINWGKNTQWAGRQLTVGLTVPLTLFGAAASQTFMEADKQLTRLAKVYGDASKGMVDPAELQQIRGQTLGLAKEIAASMGVAAEETLGIAADIAATGKEGNELLAATNEAMRLSVLGEVDRQEAMRATLSIQNVFKKDTQGLTESINFLNAVENQTSTSLNDLVTGIVKAGPVVQGLGGDIEDLALMMVAMREGGVPAAEAANAIKSSLASLINPTKQTTSVLNAFGVDLISIVDKNAGDVIGTLVDLQSALAGLDELSRQRAIEQIFGKFQFSRINALLNNLGKAGSQTQQVLELAGLSTQELAENADRELSAVADSVTGRFQRALESLKANLIPIGEVFTKVGTMLLEVGSKILEIFNNLPEPVKNFIQGLMFITGLAGPIIMITGVFGNFLGYLLKGVSSLMAIKKAGRGVFEHFTPESIAAKNASELITKAFYDEKDAINLLNSALEQLNKTLVEMQQNSNAAVGSMQNLSAGTMAAAEAGIVESSYYRRTGTGGEAGMAGGVFSHRSSKKAMTEVEAGLVAGTGSLLPADFVRATTINTIIKEDVVPIIAEGANQASIELVENLREKLNKGLRGGLRPDEERRVFQTKEAYLGETTGQVAYPAILAKAAAQGVAGADIIQAQRQFADDIVKSGIESAMSNLRTSMTNMGVDLGLEVDKIHTELADVFEKTMRDTGGDVVTSMEEVRKAAQGMEEKAKQVLTDSNVPVNFATGADVKAGQGMSKKVSTAAQLAMGEYFGLKPEIIQKLQESSMKRIDATNQVTEAERRLAATDQRLSKMSVEELSVINKNIESQEIQYGLRRKMARKQEAYARIEGKWYQVLQNETIELTQGTAHQKKLSVLLERKMIAERRLAVANSRLERLKTEEARASYLAAQANLKEADASLKAAQADLNEASTGGGVPGGKGRGGFIGRVRGLGRTGGMAALGSLSMATMLLPTGEEGSATATATNILGGAGMGASIGMMAGPPGILAGAIIGGAIPAITAYIDAQQKATDAMVRYGQAASGSALTIEEFGKELGRMSPSQRLAQAVSGLNIPKEMREQAKSILESETGQSLIGLAKSLGGDERKTTLLRELQQLTLSEIFTPDEARAVAEGLAVELGDPMLGKALVSGIVTVLDKDGNLIKDAISKQFIGSMPTPEEIAKLAPTTSTMYTGGGVESKVYTDSRETTVAKMSQIAGVLKNISDAEDLATLSLQSGEITREDYLSQLDEINSKRATAIQIAKDLMNTQESLIGKESVLGDIAAMQGITEEFDKVVDKTRELQGIIGTGDAFALQIESMAAYGQVAEGDIQNVINMINADPNLKITVSDIFETTGAEDYALDIINMINQGMDANKIKVIIDAEGAKDGVELINTYNTLVSSMPLETQLLLQADINYDPAAMQTFIQNVDYVNSLPIENEKELKIAVKGNPLLEEVIQNWDDFIKLPDSERKQAIIDAIYNYDYNYAGNAGPMSHATATPGDFTVDSAVSSAISSLGGVSSGGSSGGGDSDTSSVDKVFDKRIKAQDKIIEGIKKEREERQKLLNLEKQAFDFAMQEQDLKNQIARARAEGRTAEAAMLQAQLDNARATEKQDEQERIRQENEDRRIRKAERTKRQLEKAKSRAKESTSGGGGGGGSGISQQVADAIKMATMSVDAFVRTAAFDKLTERLGPYSAFFNSKQVESFRKEMEKLGVPAEVVNDILNEIYDGLILSTKAYTDSDLYKQLEQDLINSGIAGETLQDLLPDVYGIIESTGLDGSEKINLLVDAFEDAGFSAEEAQDKVEKLLEAQGKSVDLSAIDAAIDKYRSLGDEAYAAAMQRAVLNMVMNNPNMTPEQAAAKFAEAAAYDRAQFGNWASGGYITGPGTSTSDSIPVRLSNGEYVIRASMVDKYGVPFFNALNNGMIPMMARGGMVSRYPSIAAGMAGGGYVRTGYNMGGLVSGNESEYNINVYVTESNASADDIANKVMQSLQRRDKMNRAGIRI